MENRLDKFFKKKLDNRSFEIQDAYWADMEKKLDSLESKPQRRYGLWIFSILILISFSFIFYQKNANSNNSSRTDNLPINDLKVQANSNNSSESGFVEDVIIEDLNKNHGESPIGFYDTSELEGSEKIPKRDKNSGNESFPNHYANSESSRNVNLSPYEIENSPKDLAIGFNSSTNTEALKETPITSSNSQQQYNISNSTINSTSLNEGDHVVVKSNQNGEIEIRSKQELVLTSLPLLTNEIEPHYSFEIPLSTLNTTSQHFGTKVIRGAKFNVGGYFGALSNTEIHGLSGGLSLRLNLSPNLSLNSGLRYNYMEGVSPITKRTTALEYGFRSAQQNAHLKATSFHFVEVPLSISYKVFKHNVGLNMDVKYLAGLRGDITKLINETGLEDSRNTWIVTDGLNRIIPSFGIYYGYDILDKARISFEANYALKTLGNEVYERANDVQINMNSNLWLQLGMNFYLRK